MFEKRSLGSLVERQQGGGTPERNNPRFWNGPIPWASVKDFADNQLILNSTEESITQQGLTASSTNLIPAGTPLVCTRMAVGRCAISNSNVTINQDVKALFPKANVSPRYLLRLLDSLKFHAESVSVGSTVKGIRISDLLGIQTPIAPPHEQTKIAQILDTLDTQIQKTKALIAKLEKIKEGLLHDLLTRGIDQNGQLRPTPEQAPEFYKESALGLIPMEWEAMRLKSVTRIAHGYAFSGSAFTDKPTGPVLLTPGNFHRNGGLYFTERNTKWYSGKVPVGYTLSPGDIVTVMTDLSPQTLILGMTTVVQKGHELLHNQRIGKIVLSNPKRWCSMFLSAQMSSFKFRSRVIAKATGTTVRHTSPEKILSEYVLVPGVEEQTETSRIIATHEQRISEEKNVAKKLLAHKHGLMDDLLTGRVRVTPLLKDAV
jgi:type I restriction enzyme S subunit